MKTAAALPAVLLALALTAALAVGGVHVTRQLAAAGSYAERGTHLEPTAQGALVEVVVSWDSGQRQAQQIGEPAAVLQWDDRGIRTQAWVTRFTPTAYWVVAESGTGARPRLRRRVSVLVHTVKGVPRPVRYRAWSELP
jgi:hypothetical protein